MKIKPAITIQDRQIFNKNGEPVNLRGFTIDNNSCASEASLQIIGDDFDDTFSDIKSRGCSMVRCVVYWDVVEPEEGCFNEEYLAKLRNGIKEAEKNDLLVYLVPKAFSNNKMFWGRNTYPADYSELYNSSAETNNSLKPDLVHQFGVLFITELRKKHPQYYFIAEETDVSNNSIWIKEEHLKYNIISGVLLENNHSMFIC